MKKKLFLIFLPVVLFAVLWSIQWRRSHPPATAEDLNIESLLRQADKMDVNAQVAAHETIFQVQIAEFHKDDFYPLTRYFRLGHGAADFDNTKLPCLIWFRFFKGKQELVAVSNANFSGYTLLEYSVSSPKSKPKRLHRATAQRFYQFVLSHPKLIQEIESAGG